MVKAAYNIPANPLSTKIRRRLEIFRGSQQNRVSNKEEPPRAGASSLYLGLQWVGGGGTIHVSGSVTQIDNKEVCFILY